MPKKKLSTNRQQCPKCKSARVVQGYPDIRCLACGWSEPLIDFPVSWDWHRHYSIYYSGVDPGPNEPPEHPELKAIEERLENIEQTLTGLTPEDLRQLKIKHIYDEVQDIRRGLQHTQRVVTKAIRKKHPKAPKTKLTEV
jgi:hypothetical protein